MFEGISVAMLLPIFELFIGGGDPANLENPSIFWRMLNEGFAYIGLDVSLQTMSIVTFSAIFMRQLFKYASAVLRARIRNYYIRNAQVAIIRSVFGANISYFDHGSTGDLINDLINESAHVVGMVFLLVDSLFAVAEAAKLQEKIQEMFGFAGLRNAHSALSLLFALHIQA